MLGGLRTFTIMGKAARALAQMVPGKSARTLHLGPPGRTAKSHGAVGLNSPGGQL
jgi:hypothetical protein